MVKKIGYARSGEGMTRSLEDQIADLKAIGCIDVFADSEPYVRGTVLAGLKAAVNSLTDGDLLVTHNYQCLSPSQDEVDLLCMSLGAKGIITVNLAGAKEMGFASAPTVAH